MSEKLTIQVGADVSQATAAISTIQKAYRSLGNKAFNVTANYVAKYRQTGNLRPIQQNVIVNETINTTTKAKRIGEKYRQISKEEKSVPGRAASIARQTTGTARSTFLGELSYRFTQEAQNALRLLAKAEVIQSRLMRRSGERQVSDKDITAVTKPLFAKGARLYSESKGDEQRVAEIRRGYNAPLRSHLSESQRELSFEQEVSSEASLRRKQMPYLSRIEREETLKRQKEGHKLPPIVRQAFAVSPVSRHQLVEPKIFSPPTFKELKREDYPTEHSYRDAIRHQNIKKKGWELAQELEARQLAESKGQPLPAKSRLLQRTEASGVTTGSFLAAIDRTAQGFLQQRKEATASDEAMAAFSRIAAKPKATASQSAATKIIEEQQAQAKRVTEQAAQASSFKAPVFEELKREDYSSKTAFAGAQMLQNVERQAWSVVQERKRRKEAEQQGQAPGPKSELLAKVDDPEQRLKGKRGYATTNQIWSQAIKYEREMEAATGPAVSAPEENLAAKLIEKQQAQTKKRREQEAAAEQAAAAKVIEEQQAQAKRIAEQEAAAKAAAEQAAAAKVIEEQQAQAKRIAEQEAAGKAAAEQAAAAKVIEEQQKASEQVAQKEQAESKKRTRKKEEQIAAEGAAEGAAEEKKKKRKKKEKPVLSLAEMAAQEEQKEEKRRQSARKESVRKAGQKKARTAVDEERAAAGMPTTFGLPDMAAVRERAKKRVLTKQLQQQYDEEQVAAYGESARVFTKPPKPPKPPPKDRATQLAEQAAKLEQDYNIKRQIDEQRHVNKQRQIWNTYKVAKVQKTAAQKAQEDAARIEEQRAARAAVDEERIKNRQVPIWASQNKAKQYRTAEQQAQLKAAQLSEKAAAEMKIDAERRAAGQAEMFGMDARKRRMLAAGGGGGGEPPPPSWGSMGFRRKGGDGGGGAGIPSGLSQFGSAFGFLGKQSWAIFKTMGQAYLKVGSAIMTAGRAAITAGSSIYSFASTLVSSLVGAFSTIKGAIEKVVSVVVSLGKATEELTYALTAMLLSNEDLVVTGSAGMDEVLANFTVATKLYDRMVVKAAALPGEAEDFMRSFVTAYPAAMKAGLMDPRTFLEISADYTALGVILGSSAKVAATSLTQMLAGTTTRQNTLNQKMLGAIGMATKDFNKLSAIERRLKIDEMIAKYQQGLDAYANSFDAIFTSFITNLKEVARVGSSPLFTHVKRTLRELNEAIELNKEPMGQMFQELSYDVLDVVMILQAKAAEFTNNFQHYLALGLDKTVRFIERIYSEASKLTPLFDALSEVISKIFHLLMRLTGVKMKEPVKPTKELDLVLPMSLRHKIFEAKEFMATKKGYEPETFRQRFLEGDPTTKLFGMFKTAEQVSAQEEKLARTKGYMTEKGRALYEKAERERQYREGIIGAEYVPKTIEKGFNKGEGLDKYIQEQFKKLRPTSPDEPVYLRGLGLELPKMVQQFMPDFAADALTIGSTQKKFLQDVALAKEGNTILLEIKKRLPTNIAALANVFSEEKGYVLPPSAQMYAEDPLYRQQFNVGKGNTFGEMLASQFDQFIRIKNLQTEERKSILPDVPLAGGANYLAAASADIAKTAAASSADPKLAIKVEDTIHGVMLALAYFGLALNPFAWIAGAVISSFLHFMTYLEAFSSFIAELYSTGETVISIFNSLSGLFGSIFDVGGAIFAGLLPPVMAAINAILQLVDGIVRFVEGVITPIVDFIKPFIYALAVTIGAGLMLLVVGLREVILWVEKFVVGIKDMISSWGWVQWLGELLRGLASDVQRFAEGVQLGLSRLMFWSDKYQQDRYKEKETKATAAKAGIAPEELEKIQYLAEKEMIEKYKASSAALQAEADAAKKKGKKFDLKAADAAAKEQIILETAGKLGMKVYDSKKFGQKTTDVFERLADVAADAEQQYDALTGKYVGDKGKIILGQAKVKEFTENYLANLPAETAQSLMKQLETTFDFDSREFGVDIAKLDLNARGPVINQDFSGSKFEVNQKFEEGFDPDRVAVAFIGELGRIGERKIQSGLSPLYSVR